MTNLRRISSEDLAQRLGDTGRVILLDARRREAFRRRPLGIPTAIPIHLDEPARVPDLPLDTEMVVYCLCSGQASSTRVALWLEQAGYRNVWVLDGGLPAWEAAGLSLSPLAGEQAASISWRALAAMTDRASDESHRQLAERAFVGDQGLPIKRDMAVLFVDMVESTRLVLAHPPEEVLRLVQAFMKVVVDVAVQHCGDVHDFEGDGAMLYFAGPGEAVPAAFTLRRALNAHRHCEPQLPHARFALDFGPLVIGYIGSRERRSLSFIGPSVNTAARILKLAPADGIVATGDVVRHAQRSDPDLAVHFQPLADRQLLKGWTEPIEVFVAAGDSTDTSAGCHSHE